MRPEQKKFPSLRDIEMEVEKNYIKYIYNDSVENETLAEKHKFYQNEMSRLVRNIEIWMNRNNMTLHPSVPLQIAELQDKYDISNLNFVEPRSGRKGDKDHDANEDTERKIRKKLMTFFKKTLQIQFNYMPENDKKRELSRISNDLSFKTDIQNDKAQQIRFENEVRAYHAAQKPNVVFNFPPSTSQQQEAQTSTNAASSVAEGGHVTRYRNRNRLFSGSKCTIL